MYFLDDTKSYYNYLRRAMGLKQNGKYDKELKEELSKATGSDNLPDFKTFGSINKLMQQNESLKYVKDRYPDLVGFPFRLGDSGTAIIRLNSILYDLIVYYRLDDLRSPLGPVYSRRTEDAIKAMRRIFDIKPNEYIGIDFLTRLLKEHKSIYLRTT